MQMPGRVFSSGSYRYGFNGKENDNDIKGTGNQQDYGMRIYDPRLGKFLSVDPLRDKFPFYSPYQFAGNKPINSIDLDGAEPLEVQLALDIAKWWLYGDPLGARSLKTGAEGVIADQNNLRPFHQAGRGPSDPVSQKFNSNQASLKSYEQLGKGGSEYLQFVLETWLNTLPMEQATALALRGATRLVGKVLGKEAAIILERATIVFEQSLKTTSKTPSSSAANKLLRDPVQHAEFLDNLALNSVQNGAPKTNTKLLPQFASITLDDAAAMTMKQKGTHIFAGKLHPKPYLEQLANQLGGRQNLIRSALENGNGRFPASGVFELPVNVGGTNLTIRGFINNGKPIINTIF